MKRGKNKKKRGALLFIAILLLLTGLCLFACQDRIPEDVLKDYNQAGKYYELMMYDEAIVLYNKIIEEEPTFALAYLGLGKCLSAQGRFDEARKEFKRAMDLDPKSDDILAEVAYAYIEKGLDDEGVILLEKARGLNPKNPKIHIYMGIYYLNEMEYAKAIEEFLAASRSDNKSPEPYIRLSLLYCCASNPSYINGELSVEYAKKALELEPENPISLDTLAQAYFAMGEYDLAIETEKKALEISPDHPLLVEHLSEFETIVKDSASEHNEMGANYLTEGNYSAAADEFNMAISIDPKFSDAYYNLGKVYSHLERYNDSMEYYKMAIELSPDEAKYHYNLGVVYSKLGLVEESEMEYLYTIDIDPYHDKAHNNLGVLYYNNGKLEEALTEFTLAYQLNPKTKYKTYIDIVKKKMEEGGVTAPSPGSTDGGMTQF